MRGDRAMDLKTFTDHINIAKHLLLPSLPSCPDSTRLSSDARQYLQQLPSCSGLDMCIFGKWHRMKQKRCTSMIVSILLSGPSHIRNHRCLGRQNEFSRFED
ncbi:hypothetical protein M378DRAFT_811866 [Amanita muscaria Koide BX008]|uniref:Uncharacterized protein n=1 Tax=Amanita muscaria (strain Koide BX008) TaxID=946122 RepID=A0A0C2WJU9_AMAMK|nr:hypothetical protein M378DRAFT_811866 [Amanita muscaria Koide BX008]